MSEPGSADEEVAKAVAPFKFLDPYEAEDRAIFFGRDVEIEQAYGKLFKSRLLMVYGESGSGKTSLLRCGVQNEVPAYDARFIWVRLGSDEPLDALARELRKRQLVPDEKIPQDRVAWLRQAIYKLSATLVLVFDQFEELFLFQPESVRNDLVVTLRSWLDAERLDVRFVIVIREEYLARLSEFERRIPALFENRLWVRKLGPDQTREVIIGPCKVCGVAVEAGLVDELVSELSHGGSGVELPLLQIILDALYRGAIGAAMEAPILTNSAYRSLGGAQGIVSRFLEQHIGDGERGDRVRRVLKSLVTVDGTRRLSGRSEISERASQFGPPLGTDDLEMILRDLVRDRILREDAEQAAFELRHDTLARAIHDWLSGWEQELLEVRQLLESRLREFNRRGSLLTSDVLGYLTPYENRMHLTGELADLVARSRRELGKKRRRVAVAAAMSGAVILVVVSGLAVSNYFAYRRAQQQQQIAEAEADSARRASVEAKVYATEAGAQRFKLEKYLAQMMDGLAADVVERADRAVVGGRYDEALLQVASQYARQVRFSGDWLEPLSSNDHLLQWMASEFVRRNGLQQPSNQPLGSSETPTVGGTKTDLQRFAATLLASVEITTGLSAASYPLPIDAYLRTMAETSLGTDGENPMVEWSGDAPERMEKIRAEISKLPEQEAAFFSRYVFRR